MQVPPFSLTDQLADLGSELDDAVLRVLRSGQYIGGTEIKTFEDAFAASVNCRHAVGCNSGTDALVLALRGLGIGSGDEVITASFSFFATAEAISAVGATPVFVDVDPVTYLIDLNLIEAAITPATKALLPVHLFGRPVELGGDFCGYSRMVHKTAACSHSSKGAIVSKTNGAQIIVIAHAGHNELSPFGCLAWCRTGLTTMLFRPSLCFRECAVIH